MILKNLLWRLKNPLWTLKDLLKKLQERFLPMTFTINLKKGFNQDYYTLHRYDSKVEYASKQTGKTTDKLNRGWTGAWTNKETISRIADYLEEKKVHDAKGLCHGVRTGDEVSWFNKTLGGKNVIGTDIDPTASAQADNITQWDFQEENDAWKGKFDFIYSNSHDHASHPEKALQVWSEQINENGFIFLEHSRTHGTAYSNKVDCWGVEPELLPFAILRFKNANMIVKDLIVINEESAHAVYVLGRKP